MLSQYLAESVSPWRVGVTARVRDEYRRTPLCGRVLPEYVQSPDEDDKAQEEK
jgi:hypothetical protein